MLLAGVTTSEILFVFIIMFIIINLLQVFALKISMMILYDFVIVGSEWYIGIFALMICMVGSCMGLLISIHTNSIAIINSSGIAIFTFFGTVCGAFW